MINVSEAFLEEINNGGRCVNYADITLSDGTRLHLNPSDFMLSGNSIVDKTSTGKFSVGNCIGKTCKLTIANHDERYSGYDFYKAIITLYVAMHYADETIELIRKGTFCSVEPSTAGDTIVITGVDSMYKLDVDFNVSISWPATLKTIAQKTALYCGIELVNGFNFPNSNIVVSSKPEKATCRQVLVWIAEIAGGYFRITPDDYLQFIFFNTEFKEQYIVDGGIGNMTHESVIDGGDFTDYSADIIYDGGDFFEYMDDDGYQHITSIKSLDVSTDDVRVTGVIVTSDKTEYTAGTQDYAVEIKKNPFTIGIEQQIADYLYNRLKRFVFRPMSVTILNNPVYEPYDSVVVHDRKGNKYYTLINSVTYDINNDTKLACLADNPVKTGSRYFSQQASDIVQNRREIEAELSRYDLAVQNMNALAMNSMGVYTSEETQVDGSIIHYLHNKPKRSDSTIIYKMTSDGFFVSQDGGQTYTAGFDSQGNAVLNVISTIGMTFDWAQGGQLTLGGADNVNGRLVMMNQNGDEFGHWDKDSLNIGGNVGFNATASKVTIGDSLGLEATASQVTIGDSLGLNVTANQVSLGGAFGMVATASQITIAGASNLKITSDSVIIGGNSGLSLTAGQIKIGKNGAWESGITITPKQIKIGNGDAVVIQQNYISLGWTNGELRLSPDGISIGSATEQSMQITRTSISIGTYDVSKIVLGSGGISIGGSYGLNITSSSIVVGKEAYGHNYIKVSDGGITFGGSGSISLGGSYGVSINSNGLTVGGYNGTKITSSYVMASSVSGSTVSATNLQVNGYQYSPTSYPLIKNRLGVTSQYTFGILPSSWYSYYIFRGNPRISSYRDKDGYTFYAFSSNPDTTQLSGQSGYLLTSAPSYDYSNPVILAK